MRNEKMVHLRRQFRRPGRPACPRHHRAAAALALLASIVSLPAGAAIPARLKGVTISIAGTFPSHLIMREHGGQGSPSTHPLDAVVELRGGRVVYTASDGRYETGANGIAATSTAPALCNGVATNARQRTVTAASYSGGRLIVMRSSETAFAAGPCGGTTASLNETLAFTVDNDACRFWYTQVRRRSGGANPLYRAVTIVEQPCTAKCPAVPTGPSVARGPAPALDQVTGASFGRDVLDAKGPVLVYFWAEWCGPCRAMLPVLEELAQSLNGRVRIVELNVDENAGPAKNYDVRSIPTVILFKQGQVVSRQIGLVPKEKLEPWIAGFGPSAAQGPAPAPSPTAAAVPAACPAPAGSAEQALASLPKCRAVYCAQNADAQAKANLKHVDEKLGELQLATAHLRAARAKFQQACRALGAACTGPRWDAFRTASFELGIEKGKLSALAEALQRAPEKDLFTTISSSMMAAFRQPACMNEINENTAAALTTARRLLDAAQVDCDAPTIARHEQLCSKR